MAKLAPEDCNITLEQLNLDPYPIYQRLRRESPVIKVKATGRTLLTKAADTQYVKGTPELFSSNDPNTPMERAFWAQTLMRKDGDEHRRERMAMAGAFNPRVIEQEWIPAYQKIAEEYVSRLPRGEIVDLFPALSGPYSARGLAVLLGMNEASDDEMQRWSQTLIDGAGNFGWRDEPFAASDKTNEEVHALLDSLQAQHKATPNNSAFALMINASEPIAHKQIYANIKIAIGGGINEPRDSINTVVFGLLSNPDQLEEVKRCQDWSKAFEEAIRWVAPIQVSSRVAKEDTLIRDCLIPKGDVVMTIQASANRDEDVYENGEEFDVYRAKCRHQAFGNGPHMCQGNRVARHAVREVILPLLFDRFPNMSIPDESQVLWRGFGFRGPVQIPVLLN